MMNGEYGYDGVARIRDPGMSFESAILRPEELRCKLLM
jgi:hypothetical protein